jgi:hypothetical protein
MPRRILAVNCSLISFSVIGSSMWSAHGEPLGSAWRWKLATRAKGFYRRNKSRALFSIVLIPKSRSAFSGGLARQ